MLLTFQSLSFASSLLFSLAHAQPHAHTHQQSHSKRATDVVSGRGIVYRAGPDGDTGMGALSGKLSWNTNWSPRPDDPTDNLGHFVPHAQGLDTPNVAYLTNFLNAAPNFPYGSTCLGPNEPEQIDQTWKTPEEVVDDWEGINATRHSIGAKVCTPCPSNGNKTGTSGTGTLTLQYQENINQGIQWMTEFLHLASIRGYTFDCACTNWYGNGNLLEDDKTLITTQIGELVTLAAKYNIEDIVIAEMACLNPHHECQFVAWFQESFLKNPTYAESGNKVRAFAYNFNKHTLTNGDTLTPVGSAFVGDIGYDSCPS